LEPRYWNLSRKSEQVGVEEGQNRALTPLWRGEEWEASAREGRSKPEKRRL
jgi:hypothetical protein